MMEKDWDQRKKEQEVTRDSLMEKGMAHIRVEVMCDRSPVTGSSESPLTHTAYSVESLINTLLAMYQTTGGGEFISLLAYTTSCIDNIHALSADMIADKLKEQHGDEGYAELLQQMKDFYDNLISDDLPEVPDAFKDAFKREEDEDESR